MNKEAVFLEDFPLPVQKEIFQNLTLVKEKPLHTGGWKQYQFHATYRGVPILIYMNYTNGQGEFTYHISDVTYQDGFVLSSNSSNTIIDELCSLYDYYDNDNSRIIAKWITEESVYRTFFITR